MIVAKSVVPNQYWILKENDKKVGNIEACRDGYQIKINNEVKQFKNLKSLQQKVSINFEPTITVGKQTAENQVNGYHTTSRPFNAIYDVKHRVPLWTKEEKSKSWYAAGWYKIKKGKSWSVVECPKLITLERYSYVGPFLTQAEVLKA